MTEQQVTDIETALNLRVPQWLREFYISSTFYGTYCETRILTNPQEIISETLGYKNCEYTAPYWHHASLVIHTDQTGNAYFINTLNEDRRVYDFDHEMTYPGYDPMAEAIFSNIEELLRQVLEDERDALNSLPKKPWWRIW